MKILTLFLFTEISLCGYLTPNLFESIVKPRQL